MTVCFEIYLSNGETNKIIYFTFPYPLILVQKGMKGVWTVIYHELELIALDSENQRITEL